MSGIRDRPVRRVVSHHDAREILEIHLMDDAGVRRDDAEVAEGVLAPAQKRVALLVARELELGVQLEGVRLAEVVDLHRVIDDQFDRLQRVDLVRVAAEPRDAVAHRRQVDDRRDAGEVLEQHACRRERDLLLRRALHVPARQRFDVGRLHEPAVLVAQQVLEQDLQRERQAARSQGTRPRCSAGRLKIWYGAAAHRECGAGAEAVHGRHGGRSFGEKLIVPTPVLPGFAVCGRRAHHARSHIDRRQRVVYRMTAGMSTDPDPPNAARSNSSGAPSIALEWLNIEFASRCNLRCKWCSLDFDKPAANMDEALLAKALDELLSTNFTIGEIALHNGGETLMHPHLAAMLDVIASRRAGRASFPLVSLLTNGVLLNEAKAITILASGAIDLLRVSVDGGTVAAFEEIRRPAKWSRVRENVHRFVATNDAAPRRIKTGAICVVPPEQPLTVDWMEEEFRDVLTAVDSYELRYPHKWDGSKDLGLASKPAPAPAIPLQLVGIGRSLLRRARNAIERRPAPVHPVCKFLLGEMVLLPDGRVTVCCADLNARGVIGNFAADSLRDIYNSEAARVDDRRLQARRQSDG